MRGVVERLVADGGFGFIRGEDGREFFFHQSALVGTEFGELGEASKVDFSVTEHEAGDEPSEKPRAVHVRLSQEQLPSADNEVLAPEKTL